MGLKEEYIAKGVKVITPQKGFQELFCRSSIDVVFGGGVLNPQPLDSLVSTPLGFKRMGDIRVGDIISDIHGGTQTVNLIIDKQEPCVEFLLQDGRKVKSALSHNWRIKDRHGKFLELPAKDIISYIDERSTKNKKHINRYRIPLVAPVLLKDVYKEQRIIHPYLIGCLIGDGCLSNKNYRADLGTIDIDIVDRIKELGYNIVKESANPKSLHYTIKDKYVVEELVKIGLWGHLSYTKFIPDCYKYASLEDRMELLRGLFDTDGYCSKSANGRKGRVGYRTVSKRLAEDIQSIIWSIGGRCVIHETQACTRIQNGKEVKCATSYGLLVWTKDDSLLFHLRRKKENTTKEEDRKCKTLVGIVDYKILPKQKVRCINVSGKDHLYLTDNYIMTCNCGKSFAAILSVAEPCLDSKFRACFTRRTFGELKMGGGLVDDLESVYGDFANITKTDPPRVLFPSGAFIELRQINDENPAKITEHFKGLQSDLVYMDELTSYQFNTFKYLLTRNRGKGEWTGKFRGTTNPKKNSWVRKFIDWYIDINGQIDPERNGVIRYFYIEGNTVESVVWGNTKEEVYQKCKTDIDRKLKAIGGNFTYANMIKSFTFYLGRMSENVASLSGNMDYAGSVAAVGGKQAQQLIEGSWDVDEMDDSEAPIPSHLAHQVFMNDPQINGDWWVTADLADKGTDNFVALVWNGLHIVDIVILGKSTPRENAKVIHDLANRYDIADSHIVYDGISAAYMKDYIPDAIAFISYMPPVGLYAREVKNLKAEAYSRLKYIINNGYLSFDDKVSNRIYNHQRLNNDVTVEAEFIEECSVVRFVEENNGKKRLMNKKEMNQHLGRGRSMDLLDPIAMRMLPLSPYEFGSELSETSADKYGMDDEQLSVIEQARKGNVFNDSFWA